MWSRWLRRRAEALVNAVLLYVIVKWIAPLGLPAVHALLDPKIAQLGLLAFTAVVFLLLSKQIKKSLFAPLWLTKNIQRLPTGALAPLRRFA